MKFNCKPYLQLMRLDKPIGTSLLLWPTLWALWFAARGFPNTKILLIFIFGVIVMRAAGCVVNDIADRHVDRHVTRTKNRPLTSELISLRGALILFFILCIIAFILVLMTNTLTIKLSFAALTIAIIYPFMKRYTYFPQFILGIAFSFSIPMAFAALTNHIPGYAFLLMLANGIWIVAYDTQYAMVDRPDDIRIGIKSTAILFGSYERMIIGVLQAIFILLLCTIGFIEKMGWIYFFALFIAMCFFVYQHSLIAKRDASHCFRAFLNNQWIGLIIFVAIALTFTIPKIV